MLKLSISTGLFAVLACASVPNASAEPGWTVVQNGSMPVGGTSTITFSANGVCIDSKTTGLCLVAKGPDWDITLFSKKNQACYKSSLKNWAASIRSRTENAGGGPFDGAVWNPAGAGLNVAGIQTDSYITETNGIRKMVCSRQCKTEAAKLPSARLYVAKSIVMPPQVSAIVSQLYAIPNTQRLPLRLDFELPGREAITRVDTIQIAKQNVPASTFAIPEGLKLVKSDMEVFVDQRRRDEIARELQGL